MLGAFYTPFYCSGFRLNYFRPFSVGINYDQEVMGSWVQENLSELFPMVQMALPLDDSCLLEVHFFEPPKKSKKEVQRTSFWISQLRKKLREITRGFLN